MGLILYVLRNLHDLTVRRQQLAGQESSGSIDGVLALLQTCDLIIDATANARVFNLLGSVVAAARKPLLWLEIYGGRFGGMIARSRPGLDPAPQIARARIEAVCLEKNVVAPRATAGYGIDALSGPMIADDADVASPVVILVTVRTCQLWGPASWGASIGGARPAIGNARFCHMSGRHPWGRVSLSESRRNMK